MSPETALTPFTTLPSSHLFYREGASDKVYQAWIEAKDAGFVVNFAFGRRGNALSTGTKTSSPVAHEAAIKIYDKIVAEKKSKGYTPDTSGQAFAMTDKAGVVSGRLPQLLNPLGDADAPRYLDSDDWFMEEKLDGRRLMIAVSGGVVEGSNRKGLIVSLPQEVETALSGIGDAVLDGELVGTKFWVFDVLSLAGEDISRHSFRERADKRADAAYKVGRPSAGGDQVKVKFYATCSAVVAKINAQRSVALTVGGVGVGNVTVTPNFALPAVGDVVEVRYLYAHRGGSLYQATFLGVREDVEPNECGSHQLKYKAEGGDAEEGDA